MSYIENIKDLFDGKKFVNGEWVSGEEVTSEPEIGCSECREPLTGDNMWSEMTCVDCAKKLGLAEEPPSPPTKEELEEAIAETISEETESESEDIKDEREVQVDLGLIEPETTPPLPSLSDAAPMPEWWATVIENLEVLVDMPEPEVEPEMSFTLDRTALDQFVKAFEKLKMDEVKFRMSEENGLMAKEVDAAHVMMVEVEIREEAFSWGESETDTTEMEIGLDVARIRQSLDALMNGELTLSFEDRARGIRVTQHGDVETSHRLSPIDCAGWSDPKRPKLNHDLEFLMELDTKVLNYLIRFLKDADHVAFEWDPADDGRISIVKLINDMDDEMSAKVDGTAVRSPEEKVRSLYPTEYLTQMFRVCKDIKAEVVSLLFAKDYPLEVQVNGENIRFNALLAPRIESEDY